MLYGRDFPRGEVVGREVKERDDMMELSLRGPAFALLFHLSKVGLAGDGSSFPIPLQDVG